MDKDLKDAVLAAFDGEPEDKKSDEQESQPAAEEAGGEEEAAAPGATGKGIAAKRKPLATPGATRRVPVPAAVRKPAPAREAAEEAPTPAAHAVPRAHAATVHTAAAPVASGAGGPGKALLVVNVILAVLVIILMAQVAGLKSALRTQSTAVADSITDLKNYARVTVSVYAEPGKRPQRVVAVHDVVDGKVKLGRMTIQPLEEE